jgi:DNA-binding response OmpR family regulator
LEYAYRSRENEMRKCLIIGLDAQSRHLLTTSLEKREYEVTAVAAYEDGICLVRSFHPDIIVLEISTFGTDGLMNRPGTAGDDGVWEN